MLNLTIRQREVLTLLAEGRSTWEIAAELRLSHRTVRAHIENAMRSTGARNRAHLMAIVVRADCAGDVLAQREGHFARWSAAKLADPANVRD